MRFSDPFRTHAPPSDEHIIDRKEIVPFEAKVRLRETGLLILAGGQGSRMRCTGPKGCVLWGENGGKSLFQLLFEKIKTKEEAGHGPLHIAVMTAPFNHEATVAYLQKHTFFGVPAAHVDFFQQTTAPICEKKRLPVSRNGLLSRRSYDRLCPYGQWSGIFRTLPIVDPGKVETSRTPLHTSHPYRQPLSGPFDPALAACHMVRQTPLALRCVPRIAPEESIGIVTERAGRVHIVEYNEAPARIKYACSGALFTYPLGNTGMFSGSIAFVEEVSQHAEKMPWHPVLKEAIKKKATRRVDEGFAVETERVLVRKFETFLFDLFPYAGSFVLLKEARERCFAPLKGRS